MLYFAGGGGSVGKVLIHHTYLNPHPRDVINDRFPSGSKFLAMAAIVQKKVVGYL